MVGVRNIKKRSSIMSKLRARRSDTRSILTKAICSAIHPRITSRIADAHNTQATLIRGDIETKHWKQKSITCIYCGQPASEIDHYKSAVYKGKGRFICETPVNRVPSCTGCHRAGKDTHDDILHWHSLPRERCSPLHPKNKITDSQWSVAHERLVAWDQFHKQAIVHYQSTHPALLAQIVETVIESMYADPGGKLERLIQSAIDLAQQ